MGHGFCTSKGMKKQYLGVLPVVGLLALSLATGGCQRNDNPPPPKPMSVSPAPVSDTYNTSTNTTNSPSGASSVKGSVAPGETNPLTSPTSSSAANSQSASSSAKGSVAPGAH
ncbi:hypothetical protein SAMN05444156_2305 [Verrucomicrobium sp. GAS474]|nr:hypothetical protein SAMN05444156_2305 [Verrucomicrobium sp. GAS474]